MPALADRVQETTGTGTLTLLGAVSGFQSFYSAFPLTPTQTSVQVYYALAQGASMWEVGVGTYTPSALTLSRDTVLSSSSGPGNPVSLTGTANVWCDIPAMQEASTGINLALANKWAMP